MFDRPLLTVLLGEFKRESDLDSDATRAAVVQSTSHIESHTFGTVVLLSLTPGETSAYPGEEGPVVITGCAEHRLAHVLPQRGARVSEGCVFFCHVDVSFLIYRIFLMLKKLH